MNKAALLLLVLLVAFASAADPGCLINQFYDSNTDACVDCDSTRTADANSAGIESCKCQANTYGLDDNSTCIACDSSRYSSSASTDISDCICNANYYGASDNSVCIACDSGQISNAGSTSSSDCTTDSTNTDATFGKIINFIPLLLVSAIIFI